MDDGYRCRSMDELKTVLVKDYLDYRTGDHEWENAGFHAAIC